MFSNFLTFFLVAPLLLQECPLFFAAATPLLLHRSTDVTAADVEITTTTSGLELRSSDENNNQARATYVFNRDSSSNIAVYFGQTAATGATNLSAQCADPAIDIVMLAFVVSQNYSGSGYPQVNFGAACGGQTSEMAAKAPGLLSCTYIASDIATCQKTYGKKVLLSIGGATGNIQFSSAANATAFANTLWQLFGPTGKVDAALRPFGTSVVDGFDIDNEDSKPTYFDTLGSQLRKNFATDTSKKYYLSSAPQCPYPDASNPLALLLNCDFVWPQFYNNPSCETGSGHMYASITQWAKQLNTSSLADKPRVFLGSPAWSGGGSSAYASIGSPSGMQTTASGVKNLKLSNLGGGMFWDGPEGRANVQNGKNILAYGKLGFQ